MKKNIFLIALSLCMIAVTICGCNNQTVSENSEDDYEPLITYLNKSDLYFASGCDHTLIENYFKENGVESNDSYTISTSKDYGVFARDNSIKYSPKDKAIQVIYVYTENQSDASSGIVYQYTYKGAIQVNMNQPLTEARYLGEYEHQAIGITSGKSAYYSAGFTFSNIKYITLTDIADYENIGCTGQITYADNWQSASRMFDKNYIGSKCYERIEGCLTALDKLFKSIDDSYEIAGAFISPNECNHIAVIDKGYAATCLDEGLTDGSHCKICNTILEERKIIPAKGHTPVIDKGYPSTCTENGMTDGSHCSICNTVLVEQQVIPAHHNYVDGECTVCHKLKPSEGLEYSLSYLAEYGNCYSVVGVGSCVDTCLVIPDTYNNIPVRIIGKNAIKGNTLIEKVVLCENIVSIHSNAFSECTNLTQIILPKTIETIDSSAFYKSGYYNDVANWENEVLYLDTYLLCAEKEITGSYIVKNGTTLIADDSFNFCEKITAITLPNSILYIGNHAFSNCKELTSIKMSENVLDVGSYAFSDCKISSISLPKSLRSYYAGFDIKTINYAGTVAEWNKVRKNGSDNFIGVTINCLNGTI